MGNKHLVTVGIVLVVILAVANYFIWGSYNSDYTDEINQNVGEKYPNDFAEDNGRGSFVNI